MYRNCAYCQGPRRYSFRNNDMFCSRCGWLSSHKQVADKSTQTEYAEQVGIQTEYEQQDIESSFSWVPSEMDLMWVDLAISE